MSDIGHNSNGVESGKLRAFVERIERIEAEIDERKEDCKEIYTEVKSSGFDASIVRKIIARRKKDREKLKTEDTIMGLYLAALGELPLFGGQE